MASEKPLREDDVLHWYSQVSAKYLDLVGDYAGKERFFVEGDSLLLECFQDEKLDFERDFQILHVIYLVEYFLHNLHKRGCVFDIVFFQDHHNHCILPGTRPAQYLLARKIIISHLAKHVTNSTGVHLFHTPNDEAFKEYLHDAAIYFALCSDGSTMADLSLHELRKRGRAHNSVEGIPEDTTAKSILREAIWQLMQCNLDIALINGLTWQDSKVFAFVLERAAKAKLKITNHANGNLPDSKDKTEESKTHESGTNQDDNALSALRQTLESNGIKVSGRLEFLSVVIKNLAQQNADPFMLFALVIHNVLLETLPLQARRVASVEFDEATEANWSNFIQEFSLVCITVWDRSSLTASMTMSDIFDGRLLRLLLSNVPEAFIILPEKLQKIVHLLFESTTNTSGFEYNTMKYKGKHSVVEQRNMSDDRVHAILPFHHPVFDQHLLTINVTTEERPQKSKGKISQELTHWHNSGKALTGAKHQVKQNPLMEKRILRSLQRFHAEMTAYAASLTNASGKVLDPELILLEKQLTVAKPPVTQQKPAKQKSNAKKGNVGAAAKPAGSKGATNTTAPHGRSACILPPELDNKINALKDTEERIKTRLLHTGPYLDRSLDSRKDPRVKFDPDAWQVKVLDEVDAGNSLLVVAPTSAGKTFISFYAMEKVLRANDTDVIVYIAPTKALVNQIAAEVQARFKKNYKHPGTSIVAIHTRDYRVNNPVKCQILVTVPHILQIMLLSPPNKAWVPRIKTIIFDEVHSFGQSEDGVVWEQLLMMAPCQIIALSATIGNADSFADWLSSTQAAGGRQLSHISHGQRHSDLRKYIFKPSKENSFDGLPKPATTTKLGLEDSGSFQYVNPIACLSQSRYAIPPDLALEGRDSLLLWNALDRKDISNRQIWNELSPDKQLDDSMIKAEVIAWGDRLKTSLAKAVEDPQSRSKEVVDEMANDLLSISLKDGDSDSSSSIASLLNTTMPLLCNLREQDALPAILFNYNRGACEDIACHLLQQLERAEEAFKATNPTWVAKMKIWQENEKARERAKPKKSADKLSKAEKVRNEAESFDNISTFDPEQILDEFSFANVKKSDQEAMRQTIRDLEWKDVPQTLIKAFKRGIGVHHSGLNRRYRQAVEMYFRRGYLTVVVATGTLSMGINMPCKTVVFSGESVFLTALNFRQSAGRAGRRGFDLLGNVVFQDIPAEKALRLLSSRLPDLNGHFPLTTSFVLRLLKLLHGTDNAEYAKQMVHSLLSQPRLYLGGESFKEQVLHHVRFSIEYLRSQGLIDATGVPVDFASVVSRLYFVENSAFAFHALLREGFFHSMAEAFVKDEESTLRELMLVMSQLFGRREMRAADVERAAAKKNTVSIVKLPELTTTAAKILQEHNEQTLVTYRTYVATFVEQHCKEPDNVLLFSRVKIEPTMQHSLKEDLPGTLAPVNLRSAFIALSGSGDDFDSISDLCSSVRAGVFLEKAMIPHLDMGRERATPLNAYLYDFYMHGSVKALVESNLIPRGDVWFALKDFSLILATIVTSFENFLQGKDDIGLDDDEIELELNPVGEEIDSMTDETASLDVSEAQSVSRGSEASSVPSKPVAKKPIKAKKKKVVDSWDDEDSSSSDAELDEDESEENGVDGEEASRAEERLFRVYTMFKRLREEFDIKFKKMWA